MSDWQVKHIGFERDGLQIAGHDVWAHRWRPVDGWSTVELRHPAFPSEIHRYNIYEIGDEVDPVRFASGELSAGVWGFYVPQ